MTTAEPRAVFVDRHTLRYDRQYPHPIERVWDAVSTGEHLDVWLLPVTRVERRVGGRCSFTWGGPEEDGMEVGTVRDFAPPGLITYEFEGSGGTMRFELEPEREGTAAQFGTALQFTLWWPVPAGTQQEPQDWPGGELPAGGDTAWRPGPLAGFHLMLDDLDGYLAGTFTAEDRAGQLGMDPDAHARWIEVYRSFIVDECPPG
jgi:uncharacterized protein YndB with AHSA1/START domain